MLWCWDGTCELREPFRQVDRTGDFSVAVAPITALETTAVRLTEVRLVVRSTGVRQPHPVDRPEAGDSGSDACVGRGSVTAVN